ncbi:hypothetical protein [Pseudoalteromonas gelatinilytica]
MAKPRYVLHKGESFYDSYEGYYKASNGQCIDQELHTIKEANGD